jgi:hypothetical protein
MALACVLAISSLLALTIGSIENQFEHDGIHQFSDSRTDGDADGDGIQDGNDSCPNGVENWTSNNSLIDLDVDGCKDHGAIHLWDLDSNDYPASWGERQALFLPDGGYVVAGYFNENFSLNDVDINYTGPRVSGAWNAMYIVKFNHLNVAQWATTAHSEVSAWNGAGQVLATDIGLDPINGEIIILGEYYVEMHIQGQTILGNNSMSIFLLSLNQNGIMEELLGVTNDDNEASFWNTRMTISSSGEVYISGHCMLMSGASNTNTTFAGGQIYCAQSVGHWIFNQFVVMLNQSHAMEWSSYVQNTNQIHHVDGIAIEYLEGVGLAVASYVSGYVSFVNSDGTLFSSPNPMGGTGSIYSYVAILDNVGNWTWLDVIEESQTSDFFINSMAALSDGDLVIGGRIVGPHYSDGNLSFDPLPLQSYGGIVVARLNVTSLEWSWVNSSVSNLHDHGSSLDIVTVDENDRIIVGGIIREQAVFGPDLIVPTSYPGYQDNDGWHHPSIHSFIAEISAGGDWIFGSMLEGVSASIHSISLGSEGDALISGVGNSDYELVNTYGEDTNDDDDDFEDAVDLCPSGVVGWSSTTSIDYDSDGCIDSLEDFDDDNDGHLDTQDNCPRGLLNWSLYDHDSDGCQDIVEDFDDDGDSIVDVDDSCPTGRLNWISSPSSDNDQDGCNDYWEDLNDDNDDFLDSDDRCPAGAVGWSSTPSSDYDSDGCLDSTEDSDDDDDGKLDTVDNCPLGNMDWQRDSYSDYDDDGCRDSDEDDDDDGDSVLDQFDSCSLGLKNWISNNMNDHDGDGCLDPSEDTDDDNDTVTDADDNCPRGELHWLSDSGSDYDSDGCKDTTEDEDDDGDGIRDDDDSCPLGLTDWTSSWLNDNDADGCNDSLEDNDDDNDGILDSEDDLPNNPSESLDWDGDGIGNNADQDDDNDGYLDIDESSLCETPSDPFDFASTPADLDSDFICDSLDEDRDGDNHSNLLDAFPDNIEEWSDFDGDGVGDNADYDDDNDSWNDVIDVFPYDPSEWLDFDGDGVGDNADLNDDNDPLEDELDWAPMNPYEWSNSDGDSIGDNEDQDDDNDGVLDVWDVFPFDPSEWNDLDSDGIGDNSDSDIDGDGVSNLIEKITRTNPRNSNSHVTKEQVIHVVQSTILLLLAIASSVISYRRRDVFRTAAQEMVQEFNVEFMPPSPDLIGIKKGKMEWLVSKDGVWNRDVAVLGDLRNWNRVSGVVAPDRRMVGVIDIDGGEYLLRYGVLWVRRPNDSWSPLSFSYRS